MYDDFHTGIRSPRDIKTFSEVIDDHDSFTWGDFSRDDAQKALEQGKITVYSSYPIKNGVFVSTSYRQALDYAGLDPDGVHSRTVPLDNVAWINGDEGQFAKVGKAKRSGKISAEELISEDADYTEYDKPITIRDVEVLRSIGRKSINEFSPEEIKKAQKWAYKFYKELGVKSPFFRAWFGEWRECDYETRISYVPVNSTTIEKLWFLVANLTMMIQSGI